MSDQDTIFALSSGGLPSGVAIIRLSGPDAFMACQALAGDLPPARTAALRSIRTRNDTLIDTGLVLIFPAPNSFTGEDCVEFQIHGGRAVVKALLNCLEEVPGCRAAEAGEFSRRAFENGKLDLVEIEGLSDLISAETEMQRKLALEQSTGGLSSLYSDWREKLIRARALIEAELDFADEGDIPGSVSDRVWADMAALRHEMTSHREGFRSGEIIRDGFKVAIVGAPNAGKSSLMNALARRDVAIVTEYEGTTRDILHCDLDLEGYAVRVYDTAGIRETDNAIEREGIRRATKLAQECDLVLYLVELGRDPEAQNMSFAGVPVKVIGTKADIHAEVSTTSDGFDLVISSRQGSGLPDLLGLLKQEIGNVVGDGTALLPARMRHEQHVREAEQAVGQALQSETLPLELRAEYLRSAGDAIGRLTGRIDVETLLGSIFSEFCVGK